MLVLWKANCCVFSQTEEGENGNRRLFGAPGNRREHEQRSGTYVYMWIYGSFCVAPLTVAHLKI